MLKAWPPSVAQLRPQAVIPGRAKREPGIHTPGPHDENTESVPFINTGDMDSGLAASRAPE